MIFSYYFFDKLLTTSTCHYVIGSCEKNYKKLKWFGNVLPLGLQGFNLIGCILRFKISKSLFWERTHENKREHPPTHKPPLITTGRSPTKERSTDCCRSPEHCSSPFCCFKPSTNQKPPLTWFLKLVVVPFGNPFNFFVGFQLFLIFFYHLGVVVVFGCKVLIFCVCGCCWVILTYFLYNVSLTVMGSIAQQPQNNVSKCCIENFVVSFNNVG